MNLKDRIKLSDRATKSLQDVGANLQKAIQAFTEIGEAIAKEDPEISDDMNEACCEAVRSADEIAKLINVSEYRVVDKLEVVQASRILLGAITRSLLLADVVAVKKLVRAATKVFCIFSRHVGSTGRASSQQLQMWFSEHFFAPKHAV